MPTIPLTTTIVITAPQILLNTRERLVCHAEEMAIALVVVAQVNAVLATGREKRVLVPLLLNVSDAMVNASVNIAMDLAIANIVMDLVIQKWK